MPYSIITLEPSRGFEIREVNRSQEDDQPKPGVDFVVPENINVPTLWYAAQSLDPSARLFMTDETYGEEDYDLSGLRFAYPSAVKLKRKNFEHWYHLNPGYPSPKSDNPDQKEEEEILTDKTFIESTDFDELLLTVATCKKGTERDIKPDISFIDVAVPYFVYSYPHHYPVVLRSGAKEPDDIHLELETFYKHLRSGPRLQDSRVTKMFADSELVLESLYGNEYLQALETSLLGGEEYSLWGQHQLSDLFDALGITNAHLHTVLENRTT